MTESTLETDPGRSTMKPSFWTRRKAAIAAGLGGLVVGLVLGAAGANDPSLLTPKQAAAQAEEDVAAAVAPLEQQIAAKQAEIEKVQSEAAVAQDAAVAAAVAAARKQERAAAAAKIADAERRADTAEAEAKETAPQSFAGDLGGTDPHFGTCGEANDAGYGPYVRGEDPEYDWYDDRDNDGRVCES